MEPSTSEYSTFGRTGHEAIRRSDPNQQHTTETDPRFGSWVTRSSSGT